MSEHETIAITRATEGAGAPAVPELVIPRQLGSVRLVRQVGQGGMGVVWLGHDEMLGRPVAVKFLLGALAAENDPHFATFIEGARAAAALQHPGLTAIYHADLVDRFPYLVMEYVDGPTVAQVQLKIGALPLEASLAIMDASCEAIGELHDRQIVHRDIKPANVMLAPDSRVVVTDFGLTCSRSPGMSGGGAAGGVAVAGTPAYMPPEMFEGAITLRGDVYSLGAMLYELLTDEVPYDGPLLTMSERKRTESLAVGPLESRGVPAALVEVIERALHRDALYRYKSSRHLQRAIREACPEPRLWTAGAIGDLRERYQGAPVVEEEARPGTGAAYYESLSTLAKKKQRVEEEGEGDDTRASLCAVCGGEGSHEEGCRAGGRGSEGGTLSGASPRWRKNMWTSAHVLLGSGGVLGASVMLDAVHGSLGVESRWLPTVRASSDAFGVVSWLGILAAYVMLTRPERSVVEVAAPSRWVLQVASLAALVIAAVSSPLAFLGNPTVRAVGVVVGMLAVAGASLPAGWHSSVLARAGGDRRAVLAGWAVTGVAGVVLLCLPATLAGLVSSPREAAVLTMVDEVCRFLFAGVLVAAGVTLRSVFGAGGREA